MLYEVHECLLSTYKRYVCICKLSLGEILNDIEIEKINLKIFSLIRKFILTISQSENSGDVYLLSEHRYFLILPSLFCLTLKVK